VCSPRWKERRDILTFRGSSDFLMSSEFISDHEMFFHLREDVLRDGSPLVELLLFLWCARLRGVRLRGRVCGCEVRLC